MAVNQLWASRQNPAKDALCYLLNDCVLQDIGKRRVIPFQELCWSMRFVLREPAVGVKNMEGQTKDPIDDNRKEVGQVVVCNEGQ